MPLRALGTSHAGKSFHRQRMQCRRNGTFGPFPYVDASLMNFFRPGGLNPSISALSLDRRSVGMHSAGDGYWRRAFLDSTRTAILPPFTGCVPFGDMDANYSNGSSIYHGFTANLRKRYSDALRISRFVHVVACD